VTYVIAWKASEMYTPGVKKPTDPRWHVLNSGGTRTLCEKYPGPDKPVDGLPDFSLVCNVCENKRKAANRKART
jgi:hypothetical protein